MSMISTEPNKRDKSITLVCGQLCSGKSTVGKNIAQTTDATYIEMSDIVANVVANKLGRSVNTRSALQNTQSLTRDIIAYLIMNVESTQGDIVIGGIRQPIIAMLFPEATLVWVDCPKETRRSRFENRERNLDDDINFDYVDQKDIDLGVLEVKQYILQRQL